ncbi:MAG: hypothetical protein KDD29_02600 [Flavobacteriales bacterium]|nr:hypothetical protein [Flavobacteriales bacterium]
MKKFNFILTLLFISTISLAQTASENITKKWSLHELEEFGEKYALTDAQQNDYIEFTADNKYMGTVNGEAIEGTWSEKSGTIVMAKGANSKFKVNWIKVITLEAENLVITYQSVDLIKTSLFYIPTKE